PRPQPLRPALPPRQGRSGRRGLALEVQADSGLRAGDAQLVHGRRQTRHRPRSRLDVNDALGGRAIEGDDGVDQGLLGLCAVLCVERRPHLLHEGTHGALDGAVAQGALDSLTIALFGGGVIGHDKTLLVLGRGTLWTIGPMSSQRACHRYHPHARGSQPSAVGATPYAPLWTRARVSGENRNVSGSSRRSRTATSWRSWLR